MEKKLYMVETVSIFRHRYVVNAEDAVHASDEIVMNLGNEKEGFHEFSQKHIDESIMDVREISTDEYIKEFDKDNDYLKNWPIDKKFQFVIDIDYSK